MSTASLHSTSYKIKLIITFLPLLLFFTPLDYTLKLFFIITLWGILTIALDTMDKLIPSIAMPTLYILLGVAPADVVYSPWAQSTITITASSLVMAVCLSDCGLLNRISAMMLQYCGGKLSRACWLVFLVSLVLNTVTFASCIIFMAALLAGMISSLHLEKTKEGALLFMSAFWAGMSVQVFMFQPMSVPIVSAAAGAALNTTFNITWLDFLHAQWPLIILCFIVEFVFIVFFKANKSSISLDPSYFKKMLQDLGPMSKREKWGALLLFLMILYILTAPIHGKDSGIGFMFFTFLSLIPGIDVCRVQNLKEVDWGVLFFVAAFLGIGTVASTIGVSGMFSNLANSLIGQVGTGATLGIIMLFGTLANFILTPVAILTTFGGPMAIVATTAGFSPYASMFTLIMTEWMIVLPYESMPSAVCYGFNSVTMKQFAVFSLVRLVLFFLFFFIALLPWWNFIGYI